MNNPFLDQNEASFAFRDDAYDYATFNGGRVTFVPGVSEPWVVVQDEEEEE